MTTYNVHIYRKTRLTFEGIEAKTLQGAVTIARAGLTSDADDIDDYGEDLAAVVGVAGDDESTQSVAIDFELERQRKAAPKLLATLESVAALRRKWRSKDEAETIDSIEYMDGLDTLDLDAVIADAEAAGIIPASAEIDIDALLAARRQIAVVWSIEDVQSVRADLTNEQAWEVLQAARRHHDASIGINWQVLECHAELAHGDAPESESDEE